MITSSYELATAHQQLSGLVKRTEIFIGSIARQGYKELEKLPAADGYPTDVVDDRPGSRQGTFFQPRVISRTIALPDGPIPISGCDFQILRTATVAYRRQHYINYGNDNQAVVHLPASDRLVEATIETPGQSDIDGYAHPASISVKGYAKFGGNTKYTYPRVGIVSRDMGELLGYKTSEELRTDYALRFTGALAVTNMVATGLAVAHGIETRTLGIPALVEEWQQASPEGTLSIVPILAAFLPK